MLDSFTLTQTLGLFLALYMAAAGIGLLTDAKSYADVMDEFRDKPGLTYIAAILAFTVGAVLVSIHNLWGTPLEIIVSLIGWAALVEGALMLALRRPFFTIVGAMPLNEGFMKGYGAFVLALAAVLAWLVMA